MSTEAEHTNRLAESSSPYLLQHADNPVDWHPWSEEAFRRAREQDRPVFLSIGYSTCHWCHVMAHESFEDPEVAELLNEHYVSVKVDREERPDVDGVYMTACQMMTGRGGWPLTIVTTPDREPFFAGTYFPKEGRGGRPGLVQILTRIARLWDEDRERVLASARDATEALERVGQTRGGGPPLDPSVLQEAYDQLERTYDEVHGGFGRAPKFPTPHNLLFLLRRWRRTDAERPLEMVTSTLRAMRRGGVYDQVGHGFHRYSTDARWLVPHFEKMLYDQALLALAYLEAHEATGDASFARTAREIFEYVLRDMRDPAGGFHSAEDADSEGGEGEFYVWTVEQLEEALSPDDAELARDVYGVEERGNYADEATGERTGANILHLRRPLEELARERDTGPEELRGRLRAIREELYEVREERERPGRDDKVLADWNGLMVAALARGGFVLGEEAYLDAAREAAEFVLDRMRDEEGRLLHRWRRGEAAVPANAADYAFMTLGLIELYEATFEPRWLEEALATADAMRARCWDEEDGGFYLAPEGTDDLVVRQKEVHDGALPSANSVAMWNELRLARLTGQTGREETAEAIERAFSEELRKSPAAHTMFMVGVDFRVGPAREVVLAGRPGADDLEALVDVIREEFRPRTVTLLRPSDGGAEEEAAAVVELAPFTREQTAVDGRAAAYVCEDFTCRAPVTGPDELRAALDEEGGGG